MINLARLKFFDSCIDFDRNNEQDMTDINMWIGFFMKIGFDFDVEFYSIEREDNNCGENS